MSNRATNRSKRILLWPLKVVGLFVFTLLESLGPPRGGGHLPPVCSGPPPTKAPPKPPRDGVCPECWGYSFHRDGCSQDDGKPRPCGKLRS